MPSQTFPEIARGTHVVLTKVIPAGAWTNLQGQLTSAQWNTTDGITMVYSARKTNDGGVTWQDWGAFTVTSPTYLKDGVTKREPGGSWDWDGLACTFEITVTMSQAFTWGATFLLT